VLPSGRIYNASITGGNISEEALIANNVFQRRSLKTVLVVVYPYLTETYGPKSEYMTPHEYWAALGSVQLLKVYAAKWAGGRDQGSITSFGQYRLEAPRAAAALEPAVAEFSVNERALAEYRDLLGNARRNGAKVVGIIPLVTKLSRDAQGSAYDRYNSRIGALFLPREKIIDLNGCPELAPLSLSAENFPDGHHYTNATAEKIMQVLARRLPEALGSI
jgi:hypothetical protein